MTLTLSDFIQFCILIVAIISLIYKICKKNNRLKPQKLSGYLTKKGANRLSGLPFVFSLYIIGFRKSMFLLITLSMRILVSL